MFMSVSYTQQICTKFMLDLEYGFLRWHILVVCYKYLKNEAESQSEHN